MKIIIVILLAMVCKINCADYSLVALPIECDKPYGEDSIPFRAWDAITKLLNIFKDNIDGDNWYILALCDEYAAIAREQINILELWYMSLINEFKTVTGFILLSKCEQRVIKYQAVINHLGNNLQCVASAALASSAFFVNLKPITNDRTSKNLKSWLANYNHKIVIESIFEQLEKLPLCVNRIHYGNGDTPTIDTEQIDQLKGVAVPPVDNQPALNELIENLAKASGKILEEYMRYKREFGWSDCYLIANDWTKRSRPSPQPQPIGINTDQLIHLNGETILRLVNAVYTKPEKKLRVKYEPPTYMKQALPKLHDQVNEIIRTGLKDLHNDIAHWTNEILNIFKFVDWCKNRRQHFQPVELESKVAATEQQLHELYANNLAYVPLIMKEKSEFGGTQAEINKMFQEYSNQFEWQFDGTALQSKLKVIETESLQIRKWFQSVYTDYKEFLASVIASAREKVKPYGDDKVASTHRKRIYEIMKEFVDALNRYGRDAFELVH